MVWDLLMKRVGISKYFLGYFSNGEGVDFVDTLIRGVFSPLIFML